MTKRNNQIINKQVESQAYFNRLTFTTDREYAESLVILRDDLLKRYRKLRGSQKARVKALYEQANKELTRIYQEAGIDLQEEMRRSAGIGYNTTTEAFKSISETVPQSFSTLPTNVIKAFASMNDPIIMESGEGTRIFKPAKELNRIMGNHKKQYRRAITKAIGEGLGIEQTVDELEKSINKVDGFNRNHLRSVARTAINEANARARFYNEDKNFDDVINGYQWISILDTRTSKICSGLAGVIKKKRSDFEKPKGLGLPPLHFRCRSIVVGITDFTDTKSFKQRTRVWNETKGVEDGEVITKYSLASDETKTFKTPDNRTNKSAFDQWLRGLPESRQVQYLGPQRYKMFIAGKLGTKQLVDGDGKIRSVKELAKLIGISEDGLKEIRKRNVKAYKPKVTPQAKKIIEEDNS